MNKSRKPVIAILAMLLALAALFGMACNEEKPVDPMNPVVLRIRGLELTRFYFDSMYGSNARYSDFAKGNITQEEYFDIVIQEMNRYAITLYNAKARGYQLTAEDEASVREDCEKQWNYMHEVFVGRVNSSITDPQKIEEEVERLIQIDTGYSTEVYRKCLEESLRNRLLIKKLFDDVTDGIEPTEQDIKAFVDSQSNAIYMEGFAGFRHRFEEYRDNGGDPVLFFPETCFTVAQYLVAPGSGAEETAAGIDARLEAGLTAEQFMELVASADNADENMHSERFRSVGYLIHGNTIGDNSDTFNYAAYLADGQSSFPGKKPDYRPRHDVFTTTDGKLVAKVAGEDGTHYVMVLNSYVKGATLHFNEGDEIWTYCYEGAKQTVREAYFEKIVDEWTTTMRSEWYFGRFKDDYMPHQIVD